MYMNFNYVRKKNLFFYIKLPFFSIFSLNLHFFVQKITKLLEIKKKNKKEREKTLALTLLIYKTCYLFRGAPETSYLLPFL